MSMLLLWIWRTRKYFKVQGWGKGGRRERGIHCPAFFFPKFRCPPAQRCPLPGSKENSAVESAGAQRLDGHGCWGFITPSARKRHSVPSLLDGLHELHAAMAPPCAFDPRISSLTSSHAARSKSRIDLAAAWSAPVRAHKDKCLPVHQLSSALPAHPTSLNTSGLCHLISLHCCSAYTMNFSLSV